MRGFVRSTSHSVDDIPPLATITLAQVLDHAPFLLMIYCCSLYFNERLLIDSIIRKSVGTCLFSFPFFPLPPISLFRDFSNQNARGNVFKISVNHTDDIPYMEIFHFIGIEIQNRGYKLLEGEIIL